MKIALLADPHLSDLQNTPQEESLDWALYELERLRPDACVWLGDITAGGSADAAMRFLKKVERLPFPSVTVPGNSDIRSPESAPIMERFLSNYQKGLKLAGARIVGVNTSHNFIYENERERLQKLDIHENVLLCSHQSAKYLKGDSLAFLKDWIAGVEKKGYRVLAWVHGHSHVYREGEFEGIPTFSLCALDIDKNKGDAHFCMMSVNENDEPVLEEIRYCRGTLSRWNEAERQSLRDALGISCYHVEEDMAFAIEHKVRHLEWRSVHPDCLSLLEQWRQGVGESFSLHFPTPDWDGNAVIGMEKFKQFADFAMLARADMITVHPPEISNEIMLQTAAFDLIADAVADVLRPVVQAGIDVLVENNHTQQETPVDPLMRRYGCSPLEMVGWRNALNERLGKDACHLRFDVGHARNNEPLNEPYPIGKWYALIGSEIHGYHLHQVVVDPEAKAMRNHAPILGIHDGFISFDGFLWAWRDGLLKHAPVILEIRDGEGACETWKRLQSLLK